MQRQMPISVISNRPRVQNRLASLIAFAILTNASANACSCMPITVTDALNSADLVFRGKLTRIEYIDPPTDMTPQMLKVPREIVARRFLATIEVSSFWKGSVGKSIVLHTRERLPDCIGFWTEVGLEVLVFAKQSVVTPKNPKGRRTTDWSDKLALGESIISPGECTLSREIKHAKDTLEKLGTPRPPELDQ